MKKFNWIIGLAVFAASIVLAACDQNISFDDAPAASAALQGDEKGKKEKAPAPIQNGVIVNPDKRENIRLGDDTLLFTATLAVEPESQTGNAETNAEPTMLVTNEIRRFATQTPEEDANGAGATPVETPPAVNAPLGARFVWSVSRNSDVDTEIIPTGNSQEEAKLILGARELGPFIIVKASYATNPEFYGTAVISLAVDKNGKPQVDSSKSYTITFDMGANTSLRDGMSMQPEQVYYGSTVAANYVDKTDEEIPWLNLVNGTPIMAGDSWYLAGWNTEPSTVGENGVPLTTGKSWSVTTPVSKALHLYAVWGIRESNKNVITFDAGGQILEDVPQSVLQGMQVPDGYSVAMSTDRDLNALELPVLTSPEAAFMWWCVDDAKLVRFNENTKINYHDLSTGPKPANTSSANGLANVYTSSGTLPLYAKWGPMLYTVTFHTNGGTLDGTMVQSIMRGDALLNNHFPSTTKAEAEAAQPHMWYRDAELTIPWLNFDTVTSNLDLYAKWVSNRHFTVTYNTNGGNAINPGGATELNSTLQPQPTTPFKTGYHFVGWFKDNNTFQTPFSVNEPITESFTVYAKWAVSSYPIIFDPSGGNFGGNTENQLRNAEAGGVIIAPQDPVKTGFVFKGWYTDNLTFANAYDFSAPVTEPKTLYADWISNTANKVVVTIDTDGGSYIGNRTLTIGDLLAYPGNPMKEGFVFGGWWNESLTDQFDFNLQVTIDITIRAKWIDENTNVRHVDFESNGGAPVTSMNTNSGAYLIAPVDPTKDDNSFAGWYKDPSLTEVWNFTTDIVTTNITLYAKWAPIVMYTVTFNRVNPNASVTSPITVAGNSKITSPDNPHMPDATFGGWYKDNQYAEAWNFATDRVDEDKTLYAKWNLIVRYSVNFATPPGVTSLGQLSVPANSAIVSPTPNPYLANAVFVGWYKDNQYAEAWNFVTDRVTADTILYPKWNAIVYHTVTFVAPPGALTVAGPQTVTDGSKLVSPSQPSLYENNFDDWYTSSSYTTKWNFAVDTVTSDIALYAKFIPIIFWDVSFVTNGANSITPAQYRKIENSFIEAPADPQKNENAFAGWYRDIGLQTPWNFTTDRVTTNLVLYAKWAPIVLYNVIFDKIYSAASVVPTQTVVVNQKIPPFESPYMPDATFAGWYKDNQYAEAWNFATDRVNGNITLFAKWNIIVRYDVVFVTPQGVTPVATQTVMAGSTLSSPDPQPTKFESNFDDWYKEPTYVTKWNFTTDTVTSDRRLYAKFIPIVFRNVTFNTDGAATVTPPPQRIPNGTTLTAPPTPTKVQNNFNGWYNGNTEWNFTTNTVTADIELKAKWTPIVYRTITFNSDGGTPTVYTEQLKQAGEYVSYVQDPVKNNFVFDGWYVNDSNTKWNFATSAVAGANVALKAKWSPIVYYTMTYDANGGQSSVPAPLSFAANTPATRPSTDPTKAAFDFTGWYTTQNGTTAYNFTQPMTANKTIYAGWISKDANKKTVTFETNGGGTVATRTVDNGQLLGSVGDPTKTTGTFAGWFKESSFINPWNFATDTVTSNITLYARWKHTITFIGGSGSTDTPVEVYTGGKVTTVPANPVKTGYTFDGWYLDSTAATTPYVAATKTFTAHTPIYAKWTPIPLDVIYNLSGGTLTPTPLSTVLFNQKVTAPTAAPTKPGELFAAWYANPEKTVTFNFNQIITEPNAVNIYAAYSPARPTVTFNINGGGGGNAPSPVQVDYGASLGSLPGGSRAGYSFGGWWYTNAAGVQTQFSETTTVTNNITVVAKWNPITFTITYLPGAGSAVSSTTVASDGRIATAPTSTRTNYTLEGWYTASFGDGPQIVAPADKKWVFGSTNGTQVLGDTYLYAHWVHVPYTIKYYANYTSANPAYTESDPIPYNTTTTAPAVSPTRTGYTFVEWCTTSNANITFNFNSAPIMQDTNLYAKWSVNQYNVTFSAGMTGIDPVTRTGDYGSPVTLPRASDFTGIVGKTLSGFWDTPATSGGTKITSLTIPANSSTTYYARWTTSTLTVKFNYGGNGTGETTVTPAVEYGSTVSKPADPTWTERVFLGWYDGTTATDPFNFNTAITANKTFIAKWRTNKYSLTFDARNDGTLTTVTSLTDQDYGSEITNLVPTPTSITTGKTFSHWSATNSDTGASAKVGNKYYMPAGNITWYAVYTTGESFTVRLNYNNGTSPGYTTQTIVATGGTITQPSTLTYTGYTFAGWYKDSSTTPWDFGTVVFQGTTLNARWTGNNSTISYDLNYLNHPANPASTTVGTGTAISAPSPAPTRTDYTFKGWNSEPNGTGTALPTTMPANSTRTYYAIWELTQYTMSFTANGGTVSPGSMKALPGADLPTPERENYHFDGWFDHVTNGTQYTTAPNTDITLFAHWTILKYTITWDPNGGTVTPSSTQANWDSVLTSLPTPTRAGWTFKGWYTTSSGGVKIPSTGHRMPSGGATYFAGWTDSANTQKWTITFNAADGTAPVPASIEVDAGESTMLPGTPPTRAGFRFDGYYTGLNGAGLRFLQTTTVNSAYTVYAKWVPQVTVTFNSNGGSSVNTITLDKDTGLSLPNTPTKNGETFGGWYSGSAQIAGGTVISSSMTLTATWYHTVEITFMNGNSQLAKKTVRSDATFSTWPNVPKINNATTSWYKNQNLTGPVVASTDLFSADTVLYGKN